MIGTDKSLLAKNLKAVAILPLLFKASSISESSKLQSLILETILDVLRSERINYFLIAKTELFSELFHDFTRMHVSLRVCIDLTNVRRIYLIFLGLR